MRSSTKTLLCLLAALPSTYAATVILGDTSGNARGTDAVDIQSGHSATTDVASGAYSLAVGRHLESAGSLSMAFGMSSDVTGDRSASVGIFNYISSVDSHIVGNNNFASFIGNYSIICGNENYATGSHSIVFGHYNVVTEESMAIGLINSVSGMGYAVGLDNVIDGGVADSGAPLYSYLPSAAFGWQNWVQVGANETFLFGQNNVGSASGATIFGSNITNSTPNSTMVGPSDTAKVTILSSGNVGIGLGTASPTQKLDVGGNIRLSGNIIAATGNTLTLPSGNGTLVTTSGNQAIVGTTTLGASTAATQFKVDGTTGNVGLGAAPAAAKLTVGGAAKISGDVEVGSGSSADGQNVRLLADASSAQWNLDNNAGTLRLFTETSPNVGTSPKMVLNSSGDLGLGTTSPRSNLDIVKSHAFTGPSLNVRAFTATSGVATPALKFVKSRGSESAPSDVSLSSEKLASVTFGGRYLGTEQNAVGLNAYVDGSAPVGTHLPGLFTLNVYNEIGSPNQMSMNSKGLFSVSGAISVAGSSDPEAKLTVNGKSVYTNDIKVKNRAVIRVSPAGDIPMIANPVGTDPEL